jgi:hypothetical protein
MSRTHTNLSQTLVTTAYKSTAHGRAILDHSDIINLVLSRI